MAHPSGSRAAIANCLACAMLLLLPGDAARAEDATDVRTPAIRIGTVLGEASVKGRNGKIRKAVTGETIEAGDALKCGPGDAGLEVMAECGWNLRLGQDSVVILEADPAEARGVSTLKLIYGVLYLDTEATESCQMKRVSTPNGLARVDRARLEMGFDRGTKRTRLSVHEGPVTFERLAITGEPSQPDATGRVELRAGQSVVADADSTSALESFDIEERIRSSGWRDARRWKGASTDREWTVAGKSPGATRALDLGHGIAMTFVWIPPGTFLMGSPTTEAGHTMIEEPQHSVSISRGFWMAETECTQAQWRAMMGNDPSSAKGDDRPVETVSWDDCQAFLKKLGMKGVDCRLPTEAEWEYACRAGSTTAYYWGAEPDDAYGWTLANSGKSSHTVKTRKPNAWGLHDMSGNVWEWCLDGLEDLDSYPAGPRTDPRGAASGAYRIERGGSYSNEPSRCRSAYRSHDDPADKRALLGFRPIIATGR